MLWNLDAAVLAAIGQLAPDAYGVAIRARVGELLGTTPSVGTVHRVLTAFETKGLVRARTGDPTPVRGGRAKRLFTLTAAGQRALQRARAAAREQAASLSPSWRPS
jgi:DNA-binding PadR family transcriptional regulator